jgi:hypothetical protein
MRRTLPLVVLLVFFICFLNACGKVSSTAGQTVATPTRSTATPVPSPTNAERVKTLLQNSDEALKNLQSVHFGLAASSQVGPLQAHINSLVPASILQALEPEASGRYNNHIVGNGDEIRPDQLAIHLEQQNHAGDDVGSGWPFSLTESTKDGKVYFRATLQSDHMIGLQDTHWYVVPQATWQSYFGNDFHTQTGTAQVNAFLELALQKGTLSDKGNESKDGQQLQHIEASFAKDTLPDVLALDYQDKIMNRVQLRPGIDKNGKASIDVWIDNHTFYIHSFTMQASYDEILSDGSSRPIAIALTFNLSKFNAVEAITIPNDATPIDDLSKIALMS